MDISGRARWGTDMSTMMMIFFLSQVSDKINYAVAVYQQPPPV
jgi:hypothetical protein